MNALISKSYEPPAMRHDGIILWINYGYATDHNGAPKFILSPSLRGVNIKYADGFMYSCGDEYFTFNDLGMELFMPLGCIKLRIIERICKRRWYTISIANISYIDRDANKAIDTCLRENAETMECMWRELPQPIAEEVIYYFFW